MVKLKNSVPREKTTVLAVDDNPAALRLLELILKRGEFTVISATSGDEALEILRDRGDEIEIILLDRMMPGIDGIEFCRRIKADEKLRLIPVIMQTAAGKPQEIREGIEAGVFYYLVKPLASESLLSILVSAKEKVKKNRQQQRELLRYRTSMGMVNLMHCEFKTIAEGESLALFLAEFFPDPEVALTGISELFANAVEHGNLELDYQQKGDLIRSNGWQEEIERRLAAPEFCQRKVQVVFARDKGGYRLQIRDEGKGFDWQPYLTVDLSRATHNHGRGIAMANLISFDELTYNELGNEVTCLVHARPRKSTGEPL